MAHLTWKPSSAMLFGKIQSHHNKYTEKYLREKVNTREQIAAQIRYINMNISNTNEDITFLL